MGKIIGIDFGTTNTRVAVFDGSKPIILTNNEGKRVTPSVVTFLEDNMRLVGLNIQQRASINPKNTIYNIKHFLGETFQQVQKDISYVPYTVMSKTGYPYIMIDGNKYSPQEISASILYEMKIIAENHLGQKVKDAVITVPSYFSESQRQATIEAGQIAGLNVRRIIGESTAAAMAYGVDNANKNIKIAVFNLGSGTLDISIIDFGDGVFEVLSTNGDTHLGGDDFDKVIINWLAQEFKNDEGIELKITPIVMQRLKDAAEKAKIELSSSTSTEIYIPNIMFVGSVPKHFVKVLTRAKFEQLANDLIQACLVPCQNAIRDAGISTADIDEVILVGGSSRIPAVQTLLKTFFGKEPSEGFNPDEMAVLGAAIQGAIINKESSIGGIVLLDVIPQTLGIEIIGGVMTKLIDANTTIPCKKCETFTTTTDNQTEVTIHVLQGEHIWAKQNKSLGMFILSDISPAPHDVPKIEVSFEIDANSIVKVSAKEKTTGKEQFIRIDTSSRLSKDIIERMKAEVVTNTVIDQNKKMEFLNKTGKRIAPSRSQFNKSVSGSQGLYDVFISYRREGGDKYARTIQQALENQYRVFLDFDELKDGVFDQRIKDAISQAPVFLLLLTKGALDRCVNQGDWVREEILYAAKCQCHIVPVIIIDDTFDGIPEFLPRELKELIGAHQFSEVQMKGLFKVSIQKLINDRIAPYVQTQKKNKGVEIHIEADSDCKLLHFKKPLCLVLANKDEIIHLMPGKHKVEFVSLDYEDIHVQYVLEIPNEFYSDFIEVHLKKQIDSRRRAEESAKQMAEVETKIKNAEALKSVPTIWFEKDLSKERPQRVIQAKLHSSEKQGKWGFVDYKGDLVIDSIWNDVEEFSEGLAAVQSDNGRWGFINVKGEVVIPCKWKRTGNFKEGLCIVSADNGKNGFIDIKGTIVIPCIWNDAFSVSEGLIVVADNSNKYGVIDTSGNIVVPCQWNWMCSFSDGRALVKNKEGRYGFIDYEGNSIIECKWSNAFDFSEGLAPVKNEYGKWGYIDHYGDNVIPCQWSSACPFMEGRACVENDYGRMGFIDLKGNLVIPCQFFNNNVFREDIYKYGFHFQDGLAYVENEDLHGFIDVNGNFIKMESAGRWMKRPEDFVEGSAWVYAEFDVTPQYSNNCIYLEDRWCLIDKLGNFIDE